MANFFIIIPTLNSEKFLDRCLASIMLTQPGEFCLRVHVQDGGSTDSTALIAATWAFRGVTFSYDRDAGMYDALSRAGKDARAGELMTWLGADDLLLPGALATVASIFEQLPEVQWLTGQRCVSAEGGENFTPWPDPFYVRSDLAAGKFDDRAINAMVQQEGTFWRSELWKQVGGVDPQFRYAGDWDLWRRFAQHAPLHAFTFPLGRFTKRTGQKSDDREAYYREIDAAKPLPPIDDQTSHRVVRYGFEPNWRVQSRDHRPFLKKAARGVRMLFA
jgi:glycosyltransferase involved in cell wall biosynthesis